MQIAIWLCVDLLAIGRYYMPLVFTWCALFARGEAFLKRVESTTYSQTPIAALVFNHTHNSSPGSTNMTCIYVYHMNADNLLSDVGIHRQPVICCIFSSLYLHALATSFRVFLGFGWGRRQLILAWHCGRLARTSVRAGCHPSLSLVSPWVSSLVHCDSGTWSVGGGSLSDFSLLSGEALPCVFPWPGRWQTGLDHFPWAPHLVMQ